MKLRKRIFFLIICNLLFSLSLHAKIYNSFGDDRTQGEECFVISGNLKNIRSAPGGHNELMGQILKNDTIYAENPVFKTYKGETWLKVPFSGYILYSENTVTIIKNENYRPPEEIIPEVNVNVTTISYIATGMVVLAMLLFSILLIRNRKFKRQFSNFWGRRNDEGMKKLFYFCPQPYTGTIKIFLFAALVLVISLLSVLVLGGTVKVLFIFIKYLLLTLMWVGIVAGILGVVGTLCGAFQCIVLVIIGGIVYAFKSNIEAAATKLGIWGNAVFRELNIIDFSLHFIDTYWLPFMLIAAIPLILFLSFAVFAFLNVAFWSGLEWTVTSFYEIKNPCPNCGHKLKVWGKERNRVRFLDSNRNVHPVGLHPSWYGVFRHRSPGTGEKLPTMLFNGRDKVKRICPHCNKEVQAKTGTEKHIAIIGHRASGKTTLIYSILKRLRELYASKITFTDMNARQIESALDAMQAKGNMNFEQTNFQRLRAIQLLIKNGIYPYKLHLYDISGEQFQSEKLNNENKKYISYFRNAGTFVFLIDPFMWDYKHSDHADPQFIQWIEEVKGTRREVFNIKDSYDTFCELMRTSVLGRDHQKLKKRPINFVLVKKDTSYLNSCNIDENSPAQLERFLREKMDLNALIESAQQDFSSVHFHAVSAYESSKQSNIDSLIRHLFDEIGLKV